MSYLFNFVKFHKNLGGVFIFCALLLSGIPKKHTSSLVLRVVLIATFINHFFSDSYGYSKLQPLKECLLPVVLRPFIKCDWLVQVD